MTAEIILASASPRRRELLEQMGLAYLVRVAEVDESVLVSESPVDYVRRVAAKKSQQVWQSSDHRKSGSRVIIAFPYYQLIPA